MTTPAELAAMHVARYLARDAVGEAPAPSGITYPSREQYLGTLSKTLANFEPVMQATGEGLGQTADDIVSPPARMYLEGLAETLEQETGLSVGELAALAGNVAELGRAVNVHQVLATLMDLNDNVTGVVQSVAKTAGAAASSIEAIPILGAIVNAVLGGLATGLQFKAQMEQANDACQRRAFDHANNWCHQFVQAAQPTPTRTKTTAADLFRPIYIALQKPGPWRATGGQWFWDRQQDGRIYLPLSPASVYVALCGDAAPEVLSRWAGPLAPDRALFSDNGIPKPVRARMWRLCEAILAGAEPYGLQAEPHWVGDGANSQFVVLQDIVWGEMMLRERLKRATVRRICTLLGAQYKWTIVCDDLRPPGAAHQAPRAESSCGSKFLGFDTALYDAFVRSLEAHQNLLFEAYWDHARGTWESRPSAAVKFKFFRQRKTSLAPAAVGIGALALIAKFLL